MKILLLYLTPGKIHQNFAGDNQMRYSLDVMHDDFCFSSPHSNWLTQIDGKPLRQMRWDEDGRQKHARSIKTNRIELNELMNEWMCKRRDQMFFLFLYFQFLLKTGFGYRTYLKKHLFDCYSIKMLLYPCIVIYEHIFLVLTSEFPRCYDQNLSRVPNSIASYKEQVDKQWNF